jgi:deazaflavin-dependent oxidoreductase (nitroreductase family)
MSDQQQQADDMNRQVIQDFRANDGVVDNAVGGFFRGRPVLILHHTGAKTGQERLNPLVYATDGDSYLVTGSKGGAPSDPHWLLNVRANPDVTVEVGVEEFPATATIIDDGPRREELYAKLVAVMDQFADYETMTERRIPIVVLERTGEVA